ncbi:MAG: aconitase family protein, partial [Bacteroidales bacterium]
NGSVWFKVPKSAKLIFKGKKPDNVTAKDIVLNLLAKFGASTLLGYSVEMYGEAIENLSMSDRITISSMGTEMGAIIVMFPPNKEVLDKTSKATGRNIEPVYADDDANYDLIEEVDISKFVPMVSRPGKPHDSVKLDPGKKIKIDSAFIGSCTNGRLEDLRTAAAILKDRKVAPGVVLKIVPATDDIWQQALEEGIIKIFKDAGALVSNAGCGGCANGHVGQNGEGEVTISTGNRNFPGKQGKGSVYLASPANVAASAVAGYITTPWEIPEKPMVFETGTAEQSEKATAASKKETTYDKPTVVEGRTWFIQEDNIDTDMIFHNRYLSITDINEMGQYALDNLEGYEDFAEKAKPGDIIVTQKNFGSGSSRQQAVDCFKVLGINAILAESFGAIYERNAINAAMPVMQYENLDGLKLENGDHLRIDFKTGVVENLDKNTKIQAKPFSKVQMDIYQRGGIFK